MVLTTPWPYLTQARQYDVRPRYLIYGGLVFQPLSSSFYATLQDKSVTLRYYYTQFLGDELYLEHPEVVIISKVLPDPINTYQGRFVNTIVDEINGVKMKTLKDVADAFKKPDKFFVVRVVGDPQPLVLEASAATNSRKRILKRYRIEQDAFLGDSFLPPALSAKGRSKNE